MALGVAIIPSNLPGADGMSDRDARKYGPWAVNAHGYILLIRR